MTITALQDQLHEEEEVLGVRFKNLPTHIQTGDIWGTDVHIEDDDQEKKVYSKCPTNHGKTMLIEATGEITNAPTRFAQAKSVRSERLFGRSPESDFRARSTRFVCPNRV